MPFPEPETTRTETTAMAVGATDDTRLLENQRTYRQLVDVVRRYAERGDLERVLRAATVAGNFAWAAATGAVADPDVERLVLRATRPDGEVFIDRSGGDGRILHVLSEGYPVGGHTRLAWRWIERDGRRADVALTMQSGRIPEDLRRAAERSGGQVYDLREGFPTLTGRARALRDLMSGADVVVFHVHPFDATALAAAGLPGGRPPIIFDNHADHAFWLGLGCADVIADSRASGQLLCRELRGVQDKRLGFLPLPIDPAPAALSRKAVRRDLHLRPSQVAALTVASAVKMSPIWGEGFDQVLGRVLSEVPDLVVFLVGPEPAGVWSSLRSRFPGRVFPLGVRENASSLFAGMDIYLDSFPLSSATSILEAAAAGLPPLSLSDRSGRARVFQADVPGLAGTGHLTSSESEYVATLQRLVADREARLARGETARDQVMAIHSGAAWNEALEELYERAGTAPIADLAEYPEATVDVDYGGQLLPLLQQGGPAPDPARFGAPLGPQFDARLRFDIHAATSGAGQRTLKVRVSSGWEQHPAWMMRLTRIALQHPQLSVSLPLVAGDDGSGTRSVRALEPVLAANGTTTQDCGDLNIDARRPALTGLAVAADLPLSPDALDELETFLGSPMLH